MKEKDNIYFVCCMIEVIGRKMKATQSKSNVKGLLDAIDAKGLTVEEVIKWVEDYKAE